MRAVQRFFLFSCLSILALAGPASVAFGQARPDTGRNVPVPDSLRERQAGPMPAARMDTVRPVPSPGPVPKRAALYSAILPSAGQVYNRQVWKVPLIYTGVVASSYFIAFNQRELRRYRVALIQASDGDPATVSEFGDRLTVADLTNRRNIHQRYLDLTYLFTALGYTVQVLDALVYAHLKGFDISPDISFHAAPVVTPAGGMGIGLVMRF